MSVEYIKEDVNLSEEIGEVDMNKPETLARALRVLGDAASKNDHDVPKSSGLWLKYLADAIEAGLVDHKRQDIGKPVDITMGVINAFAIVSGFFALGLSSRASDVKLNKKAFAEIFEKNLTSFNNPEFQDLEPVPDNAKDRSIVGKFLSDISGGTIH